MSARPLPMLSAAAMLASLFLPWLAGPLGKETVPWNALKSLDGTQLGDIASNLPPEGMAFVASFVLAAILLLLGLMGSTPRLISLITGAIPVGLVAWGLYSVSQQGSAAGLPISGGSLSDMLQEMSNLLGPGAWAWLGGGTMLLALGLFSPGRRG
jgi:hypothetical protein